MPVQPDTDADTAALQHLLEMLERTAHNQDDALAGMDAEIEAMEQHMEVPQYSKRYSMLIAGADAARNQ